MLSLFVKASQQYGNRDVVRSTHISYVIGSINGDHLRHCNIHKTLSDYVTSEHLLGRQCCISPYSYCTVQGGRVLPCTCLRVSTSFILKMKVNFGLSSSGL